MKSREKVFSVKLGGLKIKSHGFISRKQTLNLVCAIHYNFVGKKIPLQATLLNLGSLETYFSCPGGQSKKSFSIPKQKTMKSRHILFKTRRWIERWTTPKLNWNNLLNLNSTRFSWGSSYLFQKTRFLKCSLTISTHFTM